MGRRRDFREFRAAAQIPLDWDIEI